MSGAAELLCIVVAVACLSVAAMGCEGERRGLDWQTACHPQDSHVCSRVYGGECIAWRACP